MPRFNEAGPDADRLSSFPGHVKDPGTCANRPGAWGNHREYPELHDAVAEAVRDERLALRHSVYYVRVGDLIKIGKTTQLRQRLLNYPPGSELLAVEYGSGDIEAMRLHQFRHLLAERKEWFRPGEDLLAHIATLKAA